MGDELPTPLLANGWNLFPIYVSGTVVLLGATIVGLVALILSFSRTPVAGRWAAVLSIVVSLGSFTTPLFYQRIMAGYPGVWRSMFQFFGTLALLPLSLSALALVQAHRRSARSSGSS